MITREQAKEKLKSFGVEEPTDDRVTDYINSISGEIKDAEDKAKKYKAEADKAKDIQKELDELKNKNLSEDEKKQQALDEANARIAELEKSSIASEIKAIFGAAGIKEEEYAEFVDAFSAFDLETAKAKANALVKTFGSALEAKEKEVKEKLMDETKGGGSGGNPSDTRTQAEKDAEAYAKSKVEVAKASNDVLSQYGIGGN